MMSYLMKRLEYCSMALAVPTLTRLVQVSAAAV